MPRSLRVSELANPTPLRPRKGRGFGGVTTKDQIDAYLARKGATVCPPATTFADQARPLKHARRELEQGLMHPDDDRDHEVIERERGAETRYLEIQGVRR